MGEDKIMIHIQLIPEEDKVIIDDGVKETYNWDLTVDGLVKVFQEHIKGYFN